MPGKSVDTDSSSDDEPKIKWGKDQIRKLLQFNKAFDNGEAGSIPDGTLRKKPRGDAQGGCVDVDEVRSAGGHRRNNKGAIRDNDEPNGNRSHNKKKKKGKGRAKGNDFLSLGQMKRDAQSSAAAMSRYKQRLRKE